MGEKRRMSALYEMCLHVRDYLFNPLMFGGNKKVTHALTNLQVSLSMCDVFVTTS